MKRRDMLSALVVGTACVAVAAAVPAKAMKIPDTRRVFYRIVHRIHDEDIMEPVDFEHLRKGDRFRVFDFKDGKLDFTFNNDPFEVQVAECDAYKDPQGIGVIRARPQTEAERLRGWF